MSAGKDSWSETTYSTKHFNNTIFEGLEDPVWRQTRDLDTDEIIESRPFDEDMLKLEQIPAEDYSTFNIKTTVWFGKTNGFVWGGSM